MSGTSLEQTLQRQPCMCRTEGISWFNLDPACRFWTRFMRRLRRRSGRLANTWSGSAGFQRRFRRRFRRRVWEALVQRPGQIPQGFGEGFVAGMRKMSGRDWRRCRVRFNIVTEGFKEGRGSFGADDGSGSTRVERRFRRIFRRRSDRLLCRRRV